MIDKDLPSEAATADKDATKPLGFPIELSGLRGALRFGHTQVGVGFNQLGIGGIGVFIRSEGGRFVLFVK